MPMTRRQIVALGAALPFVAATATPASADLSPDTASLWARLFAGTPEETFAWWFSGTLYAHVDRLREFPVAGLHAVMIARTHRAGAGLAMDVRTIGFFADLDSGAPANRWHNAFTGRDEVIPAWFVEGPGRYTMQPAADGAALSLTSAGSRTNRIVATAEAQGERRLLTQIEGTLQGFPGLDGALPALDSAAVTERQTRLQIVAASDAPATRGFFSHVYDALPPWLGFGDALGSGLSKGQMRRAAADEIVDPVAWRHLKRHVPAAFAGDRLVLR